MNKPRNTSLHQHKHLPQLIKRSLSHYPSPESHKSPPPPVESSSPLAESRPRPPRAPLWRRFLNLLAWTISILAITLALLIILAPLFNQPKLLGISLLERSGIVDPPNLPAYLLANQQIETITRYLTTIEESVHNASFIISGQQSIITTLHGYHRLEQEVHRARIAHKILAVDASPTTESSLRTELKYLQQQSQKSLRKATTSLIIQEYWEWVDKFLSNIPWVHEKSSQIFVLDPFTRPDVLCLLYEEHIQLTDNAARFYVRFKENLDTSYRISSNISALSKEVFGEPIEPLDEVTKAQNLPSTDLREDFSKHSSTQVQLYNEVKEALRVVPQRLKVIRQYSVTRAQKEYCPMYRQWRTLFDPVINEPLLSEQQKADLFGANTDRGRVAILLMG